eukprot:gene22431-29543_t
MPMSRSLLQSPEPFPYLLCNDDLTDSLYRVSFTGSDEDGESSTLCFTVSVGPSSGCVDNEGEPACCSSDLDQMQIEIGDTCTKKSVSKVMVAGEDKPFNVTHPVNGQPSMLTVSGIGYAQSESSGLPICVTVATSCINKGPTYCGKSTCGYSIQDSDSTCCTVGSAVSKTANAKVAPGAGKATGPCSFSITANALSSGFLDSPEQSCLALGAYVSGTYLAASVAVVEPFKCSESSSDRITSTLVVESPSDGSSMMVAFNSPPATATAIMNFGLKCGDSWSASSTCEGLEPLSFETSGCKESHEQVDASMDEVDNSCTPIQGYVATAGMDHSGDDIKFVSGSVGDMASACTEDCMCQGFNDAGYIKKSDKPVQENEALCYYSRQIPCEGCDIIPGFDLSVDSDVSGGNLEVVSGSTSVMAAKCSSRCDCGGFNGGGWIKQNGSPLFKSPGTCFYARQKACKGCTSVEGYSVYAGMDTIGDGLVEVEGSMIDVAAACTRSCDCLAFTDKGLLKSSAGPLYETQATCFYVRQDTPEDSCVPQSGATEAPWFAKPPSMLHYYPELSLSSSPPPPVSHFVAAPCIVLISTRYDPALQSGDTSCETLMAIISSAYLQNVATTVPLSCTEKEDGRIIASVTLASSQDNHQLFKNIEDAAAARLLFSHMGLDTCLPGGNSPPSSLTVLSTCGGDQQFEYPCGVLAPPPTQGVLHTPPLPLRNDVSCSMLVQVQTFDSPAFIQGLSCETLKQQVKASYMQGGFATQDWQCQYDSSHAVVVSSVLYGRDSDEAFKQNFNNSAKAVKIMTMLGADGTGDYITAFGSCSCLQTFYAPAHPQRSPPPPQSRPPPPRHFPPPPSHSVGCSVIVEIHKFFVYDYTNFTCNHLAQFVTTSYMDGIQPITPFYCSFFSDNYILVKAVLPDAKSNALFYSRFADEFYANLAAVIFDLECKDSYFSGSNCGGDIWLKLTWEQPGYYSPFTGIGGTRVCMNAFVDPIAAGMCSKENSHCCNMDLGKIQIASFKECSHSLKDMVINNMPTSAVSFEDDLRSLKITNIQFTYANGLVGDGISICFTVDERSKCPSLGAVCGGPTCNYAVFNGGKKDCCPTALFPSSMSCDHCG